MIGDRGEQLAHIPSIRVFCLDLSVPVVQRRERGFPKAKPMFHHTSSAVVLNYANWISLLGYIGTYVISRHQESARFMQPGDTTGDTNSALFC
jgi:hypothetical protein